MPEHPLLPKVEKPSRPLMRPWKWIGLAMLVAALLLSKRLPAGVAAVGYLCGAIVVIDLALHLFRRLKNYIFWSVRNRVIGSFVFVGLIPLVVLSGVIYLSLRMLAGQLASNYLEASVGELKNELSSINVEMAQQIPRDAAPSALEELAARTFASRAAQYPRLAARLVRKREDGTFETVWMSDPHEIVPRLERYPVEKWLGSQSSFEGLLETRQTLLVTSLRPVRELPAHYLDLSTPFDAHLEQRMEREKSLYTIFLSTAEKNVRMTYPQIRIATESAGNEKNEREIEATIEKRLTAVDARREKDPRWMISWLVLADSWSLNTGNNVKSLVVTHVPLQVLSNHYLAIDSDLGQLLLTLTYILLGFFVVAEVVSVVVGATISRRITRSIHDMYQGTLALQQGDFRYRIPVRRSDQLGLLAHSFNQMSGSIVRLLDEVSEKKRLEQELEIAREVQATLFPRQLPNPRGLSVFGGCEPARVVSGDYYDFVVQDEARLCIIIADISGKGISAALLMANLQAAMRNQLAAVRDGTQAEVELQMATVMRELNQQIYHNSPSEKYATLFLSRYDADTRRLYYCNAGHLPPIVLIDENVRRLEAGGAVVGLFPDMEYTASSIELEPGTVLALFTDGVTEAVNAADEEFGEERLIAALREARLHAPEMIYRHVLKQVRGWQGSLPPHDDITLILAKVA